MLGSTDQHSNASGTSQPMPMDTRRGFAPDALKKLRHQRWHGACGCQPSRLTMQLLKSMPPLPRLDCRSTHGA
eukprot:10633701-Prorocentrum_lima.AAC.1